MRQFQNRTLVFAALSAGALMISCAEAPEVKTAGSGGGGVSSDALCQSLNANATLTANFKMQVDRFCAQGLLATLRTSTNVYSGTGSPKVLGLENVVTSGSNTAMITYTSVLQSATPAKYFAMMRMQSQQPTEFKNAGYTVDSTVTYTVKSTSGDVTTFTYARADGAEGSFGYDGETTFLTLTPEQTYVVAMRSTGNYDTVLSVKGLVIINAASGGSEILSLSDQVVDNGGNADAVISKSRTSMGEEQVRSYQNGQLAAQR